MNKKSASTGTKWKWRDGEISMKEFYSLTKEQKDAYVLMIDNLNKEERSSGDEIIYNVYNRKRIQDKKVNNFISMD